MKILSYGSMFKNEFDSSFIGNIVFTLKTHQFWTFNGSNVIIFWKHLR